MNKQEKVKKKIAENIVTGTSINLIPPQTEEEKHIETRKVGVNMSAALALLFLFLLSIGIVGFNLFSKLDLNERKKELFALEQDVRSRGEIITSNDEILRRIKLYQNIEQSTYSANEVIDYWQDVSKDLGTISSIILAQGMNFEVSGTSKTLKDVSKLWYLLGNDKRIESLELKNVVKEETLVRFNFEGKLSFEEFSR
ncbi:hypothetical protein HYV12_00380 [Candidatus Dojkabacteria bacterium]|nr:hypothetical protein [Candidatus Dojkabacteria bacterium]